MVDVEKDEEDPVHKGMEIMEGAPNLVKEEHKCSAGTIEGMDTSLMIVYTKMIK